MRTSSATNRETNAKTPSSLMSLRWICRFLKESNPLNPKQIRTKF